MGAGKTYLMAAFIYLDLYFSRMDPGNAAFASNFVVFAPSGLKSSVVPSLKKIKEFDPSWIIPEPAASELRSALTFEVLDAQKSGSKSNRVKNPNVQKVAIHQPFKTLAGLVLVTNAEKVILSHVQTDDSGNLQMDIHELDDAGVVENELRDIIGKLPNLAVIIDEVHHAQDDTIKLRAVVNDWAAAAKNAGSSFNCVLGFSGTPYLQTKKRVSLTGRSGFKSGFMANVVNYYPLASGIGNFLKKPTVKIVDGTSNEMVRAGVERFLDEYEGLTYVDGTKPKIAIFCGTVTKLEEDVYPLVVQISIGRGLDPDEVVLKYHRGGSGKKKYPTSPEWVTQFEMLDTDVSTKRIVLLAQIGKEGWDCHSLAAVILSQEGDCPKNMVLQTSCRCLREVVHGEPETALVYLNGKNAKHLEKQLNESQHMSIKEFQEGGPGEGVTRHSRVKRLGLPAIEHVRFELSRETSVSVLDSADIEQGLRDVVSRSHTGVEITSVENLDFSGEATSYESVIPQDGKTPVTYRKWKHDLLHETGPVADGLTKFASSAEGDGRLRELFYSLTYDDEGGTRLYSTRYDQSLARSIVRSLFYPRREVRIDIEEVGEVAFASFVDEEGLRPVYGIPRRDFYPSEEDERKVLAADEHKLPEGLQVAYDALLATGQEDAAARLLESQSMTPPITNTYQYIPYHFDSPFEQDFYVMVRHLNVFKELGLEVYYNGDSAVADFRIDCFKKDGAAWKKVGKYTPDFLIVRRKADAIEKILIVETKGLGYSRERGFVERRKFIEEVFVPENNLRFGRERFEYKVLTDDAVGNELRRMTEEMLLACFG